MEIHVREGKNMPGIGCAAEKKYTLLKVPLPAYSKITKRFWSRRKKGMGWWWEVGIGVRT